MYKVLLVDDELLVRANIKLLIDWDKENLMLCGEASNGFEAIELIQKFIPDIIITDMLMPKMNGLEMCEKVRSIQPYISLIILSNFDDFDYVRGSLKLGAIDYILKNALSKEILSDVLAKAKKEVLQNKNDCKDLTHTFIHNNLTALRKDAIIKILTGFYSMHEKVQAHLDLLGLNLSTKNIIPVVLSVDEPDSFETEKRLTDRSLQEFGILNITEEILSETEGGVICPISIGNYALLFSYKNISSSSRVDYELMSTLNRIRSMLQVYLNISISFSIGTICPKISEIKESFEIAEEVMNHKFYRGKGCILRGLEKMEVQQKNIGLDVLFEKELIHQIGQLNIEAINKILDAIFLELKNRKISYVNCQMTFYELFGIINKYIKSEKVEWTSIYSTDVPPGEYIKKLNNLDQIKQWFEGCFDHLVTILKRNSVKTDSIYVKKAIKLIAQSYKDNLSQQSIADEIGISSSYLSTLFKEEMGVGFNEYLTDYRIKNAIMLIESGNSNYREIVKLCGFNDYNYFFKIFKKKVGITPNEYAKQQHMG